MAVRSGGVEDTESEPGLVALGLFAFGLVAFYQQAKQRTGGDSRCKGCNYRQYQVPLHAALGVGQEFLGGVATLLYCAPRVSYALLKKVGALLHGAFCNSNAIFDRVADCGAGARSFAGYFCDLICGFVHYGL
jgi:hypothetical protein